jgi:hypothetical protein
MRDSAQTVVAFFVTLILFLFAATARALDDRLAWDDWILAVEASRPHTPADSASMAQQDRRRGN